MPRIIKTERRDNGDLIISCAQAPDPAPPHIPFLLSSAADSYPDRVWLAERRGADAAWTRVTYQEAKRRVDRLTQGLLELKLTRPVIAILSGNSIEHALLSIAAMQASIAVAPISQSYSAPNSDFIKLRAMLDVIEPGAIFVQDMATYRPAIEALGDKNLQVIFAQADAGPSVGPLVSIEALARTAPGPEVARAIKAIQPDTIAKFLFTSGSTGAPKAVIHTQTVLTANVVMQRQVQPRDPETRRPVIVLDWLPWSHVMGGNAVFNGILADAGTLHIDEGRPIPHLFGKTIENLKAISPTRFSNVPSGYAMLADALEADPSLAQSFFANLETLGYAGARLPDTLYDRFQKLAVQHAGFKIPFVTGYGATEMGPSATTIYWKVDRVGLIGLPHPGVEMKLRPLPGDDRYEVRLRSGGMTPGYYRDPQKTEAAFDEEGYFRTGDAARFVDPDDAREGFEFAGRTSEEFKLLTGTFVRVGELRLSILEACPHLMDVVVTGSDRSYLGLLAWSRPGSTKAQIIDAMMHYNAANPSSSRLVKRLILLDEPPSLGEGEVTDKGYINQKAVLSLRKHLVDRLYTEPPLGDVVVLSE